MAGSERHLEDCLASLADQTLTRLEIILVGPAETLRPYAATPRTRIVPSDAPHPAAARNRGAAAAHGTYLAFVDPNDTVPSNAFTTLTRTLQRSGSDFAVGGVQRVRNGRATRPPWATRAHDLDRIAVRVDDFPVAMQDVLLGNRVFRRTFWQKSIHGLDETTASSELQATVTGYIRATSFDVLRAVSYLLQMRPDAASLVQEGYDLAFLVDRVPALERTWQVVSAEASAAVADAWLGGIIDTELGVYARHAARADAAYRECLQQACQTFWAAAGPGVWPHVRVENRLRIWLTAQGRWAAVEAVVEYFRLNGGIPPTRVVGSRVLAELPFVDVLGPDLPELCLGLADSQTALSACVRRAYFAEDGQLVVDGWAFVRGVDLGDSVPQQRASLVDSVSGQEVPVTLEQRRDPTVTRWANQLNQSFDGAAFRLRLDVDSLPGPDLKVGSRRWWLRMEVTAQGVHRVGAVPSVVRSASALRMRAREVAHPLEPVRVVPQSDPQLGFTVQLRPDRLRAHDLSCAPGGRLSGRIRLLQPIAAPLVQVRLSCDEGVVTADLEEDQDGLFIFALVLPPGRANLAWDVRAVDEDGRRHRVSWPDEASAGTRVEAADASVALWRSPRGFVDAHTGLQVLQTEAVSVVDDAITLLVRAYGLGLADVRRATLHSHRAAVPVAEVAPTGDGLMQLTFPLRASTWGGPAMPLPAATYRVTIDSPEVTCGVSDAFLEQCPVEGRTGQHRYQVARTPGTDRLVVVLKAPLRDDELGRRAQRRLADWYSTADFAPDAAVLLSCYRGEFATDSQQAIHEELRRRRSPLRLLWAVSDTSVVLPEGAESVLIGSREWFTALGRSRYLCQNIDMERYFTKRPHQRYLQTFHGYPFKSMGASLWRAQGRGEVVIEAEKQRRSSAWDAIVVPEEFCVELYRREYGFEGTALVTGYPRNDGLVRADRGSVRTEVLERLGIPPDKTVVLYAPTWRDTAATSAWTAELFTGLDLEQLAAELGEDYAVLLRGHNYNMRGGTRIGSTQVRDVSSYPEVNELLVAADVAVMDYSSMRFDWLLTDKPALFFVPDLQDYLSSRTALFEYGPTAPGPLLTTTAEVGEALLHLDDVNRRFAPARQDFNRRFNRLHDGHASERVLDAFFS